jgi:hypothetical protein
MCAIVLSHTVGFGAKRALKNVKVVDAVQFKKDCRDFLKAMYLKLVSKAPSKNEIVKGSSALSPKVMINTNKREARINLLLTALTKNGVIDDSSADRLQVEYLHLCKDKTVTEYLKKFDQTSHKLDEFLLKIQIFSKSSSSYFLAMLPWNDRFQ